MRFARGSPEAAATAHQLLERLAHRAQLLLELTPPLERRSPVVETARLRYERGALLEVLASAEQFPLDCKRMGTGVRHELFQLRSGETLGAEKDLRAEVTVALRVHPPYFTNLKFARCSEPSASLMISTRHGPPPATDDQLLSVFQTYVYWSVVAS